ncbi:MAG: 50S ribosomal protein L11 methyltransferase [Gammaproteobacteria bacterium]
MSCQQLKICATHENAELLSDLLLTFGAEAVTFIDAHDQPIYEPELGTTPLWEETWISALFTNDESIPSIISFLQNQINETLNYRIETIDHEDWINRWKEHFTPMCFANRLWICPSHEIIDEPNMAKVILDPGLAFGTGTHPTTALCLEWLAENIIGDEIIIDYGCGSGILAIAALKLGAKKAYAIDIDPQALLACKENANQNQITASQLEILKPEECKNLNCDILLANILSNPLIALASEFAKLVKPNGNLVLSGILSEQISSIQSAYNSNFNFLTTKQHENWVISNAKHDNLAHL